MIQRKEEILIMERCFQGKAILLTGPRQSGKTTLLREVTRKLGKKMIWWDGDESDIREIFRNPTSAAIRNRIGNAEILVVDEAQRIEEIGLGLKLITDHIPEVQLLVSGSSSFEFSGKINEPLTGRKFEFSLYPLSWGEMAGYSSPMEERRLLEHRLVYGYYPDVVNHPGEEGEILQNLTSSYLYKDLYSLAQVRKPAMLDKLVLALALQIGSEVSYNELSQSIGTDKETVERYVDLLERTFVLFRLPSLSRNMRNEIKRGRKIYFIDNGIRNAVIKNFNPLALRQDTGALWENFLVSERRKRNQYRQSWCNTYFWRTVQQQEIDYLEEKDGKLSGFEFKWGDRKPRIPKSFLESYPDSSVEIIRKDNFEEFLG